MALLLPSLFSSVSFTQGFAPPNKGEYFWEFPAADCMPDDELSSCPVNSTIAECKFLCINTPNCGGFNWPNRHMKKLGCMDEIVEWGNDPDHKAPVDPGHKALTLYVLSLYPQRREYMWKLKEYDCNPDHELGTCNNTATGEVTFGHCKAICQNDPFCAGFNVPNGHLKSAGCRTDTFSTKHKVPEWGQTLYIIQPTPQRRNTSWKTWAEHKGKDCAPGFELGNCSQYLPPPYSESECKSACEKNPYCGGFNLPFGHLKTVDCTQEVAPDAKDKSITLYTLTTTK